MKGINNKSDLALRIIQQTRFSNKEFIRFSVLMGLYLFTIVARMAGLDPKDTKPVELHCLKCLTHLGHSNHSISTGDRLDALPMGGLLHTNNLFNQSLQL